MSLYERDTYEVMINDPEHEGDAWISMVEEVDWDELPEYLEGVQSHELNRMEAEFLENGELSDAYYGELYGGALE